MKTTGILTKIFVTLIFGLLIGGCSQKTSRGEKKNVATPSSMTLNFTQNVPEKLRGNYYRAILDPSADVNDEFYMLQMSKDAVRIKQSGNKDYDRDEDDIYYYQVSKNRYIFKSGDYDYFFKVVQLPNGDIKIFDYEMDYKKALNSTKEHLFSHVKPDDSFGLSVHDMEHKYYVSDNDFTKYFEMDTSGAVRNLSTLLLWKVNNDGTESILERFERLVAKKGRYNLFTADDKDSRTFSSISPNKLQDAETGELYTLYRGDKSPKEDAWKKLGVKMKPPIIYDIPKVNPQKNKYDKYNDPNYDPELDDDYWDDNTQADYEAES